MVPCQNEAKYLAFTELWIWANWTPPPQIVPVGMTLLPRKSKRLFALTLQQVLSSSLCLSKKS